MVKVTFDNEGDDVKVVVIDAETHNILSEDLEAESKVRSIDWLNDKTLVKSVQSEDEVHLYVRDRTEQDIKDADCYGGNLEDA